MPNGKPGDHPHTDMDNGIYTFPPPIDELMARAHAIYPDLANKIGNGRLLKWQSPEYISEAKEYLNKLLSGHN